MPKIPMLQPQIGASRATTATVESGLTYMPFVNAVNQTGGMLENRGAQLLQEYDTTRAYTAFNQLRETSRSKMVELMAREGTEAQGAQQEYTEYYKKAAEDVKKKTINAFSQQQLFDKLSQSHEAGDLDQLARHEYAEHKKAKVSVVNGYVATVERDIRDNVNDDDKMNGMIYGKVEPDGTVVPGLWGAIDALGSGIDRTEAKLKATQDARYAAMDELINTNTKRASIKLEEWKSELGEKYAPLKKRLETQLTDNKMSLAYENLFLKFGKNADAAMSWLTVPSNQQSLGLDFKEVNQLHSRFSQLSSDRERAERNGREALERVQKDNAAVVLQSLYNPNAPKVDVNELHKQRKISNEVYEHAIKARESTTVDNPWTVNELHDQVERGIEITDQLRTAVDAKQLSEKTAASIGKHAVDEKSKRAMSYIDRALKPSESDKWSPDKHLKYADATRLYYAKVAGGMDYETAAYEVVKGYIDGVRRTVKMLPTPEGLTNDQKTDLNALEQSKQVLAEKFRSGRITPDIYREQMNALDGLIKIAIEQQQAGEMDAELEALRKKKLGK